MSEERPKDWNVAAADGGLEAVANMLEQAEDFAVPEESEQQSAPAREWSRDGRRYTWEPPAKSGRTDLSFFIGGALRHRDRPDLPSAASRARFAQMAARGDDALEAGIADDLLALVNVIPRGVAPVVESKTPEESIPFGAFEDAKRLLGQPVGAVVEELLSDARRLGLVGEERNFLALALATVSRLDERPINVLVRGGASVGKSFLATLVVGLLPASEKKETSGLSEHAWVYVGPDAFAHRVLYQTERRKLAKHEEDVGSHYFRDLAERGEASRMVTVKDPAGGPPTVYEAKVRGPVALIETTTNRDVCDEDLSRMIQLAPNDSADQTKRVVTSYLARAAMSGADSHGSQKTSITEKWKAAHTIMARAALTPDRHRRPIYVTVPYAEKLAVNLSSPPSTFRRLFPQVVSLIRAVALLRALPSFAADPPTGPVTIEATVEDYAVAWRVLPAIVGAAAGALSDLERDFYAVLVEARKGGTLPEPFAVTDAAKATHENDDPARRRIVKLVAKGYLVDATPQPAPGQRRARNARRSYRISDRSEDARAGAILVSPTELAEQSW